MCVCVTVYVLLYSSSSAANVGNDKMKTLSRRGHQHQLEILKHRGSWVDLLTSQNPSEKLHSLGLSDCFPLTSLRDLLTTELQHNWRTLQHSVLHPPWKNLPGDTSWSVQQIRSRVRVSEMAKDHRERVQNTFQTGRHNLLKRDTASGVEKDREMCKGPDSCSKRGDQIQGAGRGGDNSENEWFAHYVSLLHACVLM